MKGLVFKDLLLMKKMNKKVIFVMYFFVIAISFFGENEVYSIMSSAFFSLFIGMHLMMTMTYDGLTSWKQYELTLPMSKYQIIFSKYLLGFCHVFYFRRQGNVLARHLLLFALLLFIFFLSIL